MLRKHGILLLASASAALSETLDTTNREATINSAKALITPVVAGSPNATTPWITASGYTTIFEYSHYTGDSQYNNSITADIIIRAGGSKDFLDISPGNDDQLWWGLACMTAAEYGITDLTKPFADGTRADNWLELAQNVFDSVSSRWQTDTCGGVGWQRDERSEYRNSITNGLFFQLAARLGRYTGDKKYATAAQESWFWAFGSGLIDEATYSVYDGVHAPSCDAGSMDRTRWTYNVGVFLYGTAVMLESTGDSMWQKHLEGFINAAKADFTEDDVLVEKTCESRGTCNNDQQTFKATLARWLALTSRLVPDTADKIQPILDASAKAALSSCNDRSECSLMWTAMKYEGVTTLGAQMAAVEIAGAQLAEKSELPKKATSNGAAPPSDAASTNSTTSTDTATPMSSTAATSGTATSSVATSTIAHSDSASAVGTATSPTSSALSTTTTLSTSGVDSLASISFSTATVHSTSTIHSFSTVSVASSNTSPSDSSSAVSTPTVTTVPTTSTTPTTDALPPSGTSSTSMTTVSSPIESTSTAPTTDSVPSTGTTSTAVAALPGSTQSTSTAEHLISANVRRATVTFTA